MPDFSTKPRREKRPKQVPRYELLGADNRATFAVRKTGSIRATFHNVPVDLPTPQNMYNPLSNENTYCSNK